MQTIDEVKAHFWQVLLVAFTLCVGVAIAQGEAGSSASGVDSRGNAFGKKVQGDLGESMMDDFYTSTGYEKVDCSVGVNGADGVYVTRNAEGTIDNVILSESKTGTSQLGRLDSGTGPYQGSQEYYLRKIDEKIQALEKGPRTPEAERMIEDLKQIRRKLVYGDYRSRLFKMNLEVHNGKTYIKMQTYELTFENGPNARPTATPKGRPAMIDMTSPDSALSPYKLARRKKFYENLKNELLKRTQKGGYGISKSLTEKEAREIVAQLKAAYESGEEVDLIKWVAKKCGIGVDEAAEVVEKSVRTSTAAAKANKAVTTKGFKKNLSSGAKCKTAVTRTGEDVTAKTVEDAAKKAGYKNTKTMRGILQRIYTREGGERYILSVHVPENAFQGVGAGVLTFVIAEGASAVGFARGEMTEDEFMVETGKNAGAALVDGLAVYAVCCMGVGPAGVVSLVVGVGAYFIYEITFDALYDINKFKGVTLDDYLGILPTEIQRRATALDYKGACRILDYEGHSEGLDFKGKEPGLDYSGREPGLDFKGTSPGLGEVY